MPYLKYRKAHPRAKEPIWATTGSGCFDLHAFFEEGDLCKKVTTKGTIISTGLIFEVPPGYTLLLFSRSGHGFNHNVRLANCVGIVDSDYRGEVKIALIKDTPGKDFLVYEGDRIAQAMLVPAVLTYLEEVQETTKTNRGASGFGSTGS